MNMDDFEQQLRALQATNAYMHRLYQADWEDPHGPLRLREDLPLTALTGSSLFQDLRLFLATLAEEDGTPTTATGNLNRAFVGRMFERMEIPDTLRKSIRDYNKVLNELDLWSLHIVRVLAELSGLVRKRKKRWLVTRCGREMLAESAAGALYRRAFITLFRKLNISYLSAVRDVPDIQPGMAIILWRIDMLLESWTPIKGLPPQIFTARLMQRLHDAMVSPYQRAEDILESYVLWPLRRCGLLEIRGHPSGYADFEGQGEVRMTPLFRRFIEFAPPVADLGTLVVGN